MRLLTRLVPSLLLACLPLAASAQTTLLFEDFNDCALPPGWQAVFTGNQNPVWQVGFSSNDDALGQSIDGTCCLIIDDDATGDNTPAYVANFISPPFDASQHSTIELTMDVHYRDWAADNEYFEVLVSDGVSETVIARYDRQRSNGEMLSDYFSLKYDLSLVSQSPQTRIILRYDDAAGFGWWAAVDNILVVGSGDGTNVIAESFKNCEKPAGWETQVVTGEHDWQFGYLDTASVGYDNGRSMDGTCFAFFDDDLVGENAPYSIARMATPWFDGSDFGRYELNVDVILRYVRERIRVYVQHGNGDEFLVSESDGDIGGPFFPNYLRATLDLSAFRNQQMRVVFEYDDGNEWGWWVGIDNVKVTGFGAANDLCLNAKELLTGGSSCLDGNNRTALFDGPPATCTEKSIAGLWYKWVADFSGTALLRTRADFNDVVSVFTGSCSAPQQLLCNNRDEHGFTSERTWFSATAGSTYLIRVSGQDGGFGVPRGAFCLSVEQVPAAPTAPANDQCASAAALTANANCLILNNLNASTAAPLPTLNELARADVWYQFTAPALSPGETLEIKSNADFSDIITLYAGGCNALQELVGNHHGGTLRLPALNAGQNYWAHIAGNFATVEGNLCPQLLRKTISTPGNDDCLAATTVGLGGQCAASNNLDATFSGRQPSCVPVVDRDVWYKFVAPASGSVRLNSGAAFEHVLSIWSGSCNNLEEVFCTKNPLRCQGYTTVGGLAAGATYYVQVASWANAAGVNTGDICLKILNGNTPPEFQPMILQVEADCQGAGLATLDVSTLDGVPPYTLQGTPNGTVLNSGDIYIVVATDAMGCEQSVVGIVGECSASNCTVAAAMNPQQPSCAGASNGALSVNVLGGTPPYTYKWSNNATSSALTGLAAGSYSVTVTDALDCDVVLSETLLDPSPVTVGTAAIVQPMPGQSDGSIQIDVAGGSGSYAFAWTRNGAAFADTEDLGNAPEGSYALVVTDGNGCTATASFVLQTVSAGDPSAESFAEIFPNPARDKATLAVSFPSARTLYLSIVDGAGRVCHGWTVRDALEQNIPLDIKGLPAGAYRLRIVSNADNLVRSLVVGR
jgi:hypothetical protein